MGKLASANARVLFSVTGCIEAATGLVLLAIPSFLIQLLFGAEPEVIGLEVGRVAGAALLGLGIACWLGRDDCSGKAARGLLAGMAVYHVCVVAILVRTGIHYGISGIALWPVALGHAALAIWSFAGLSTRAEVLR
jgi:hypothetical protein